MRVLVSGAIAFEVVIKLYMELRCCVAMLVVSYSDGYKYM